MTILMTILAILAGVGGGLILAGFAVARVAETDPEASRALGRLDTTHPRLLRALECGMTAGVLAGITLVGMALATVIGVTAATVIGSVMAVTPIRMLFGI